MESGIRAFSMFLLSKRVTVLPRDVHGSRSKSNP